MFAAPCAPSAGGGPGPRVSPGVCGPGEGSRAPGRSPAPQPSPSLGRCTCVRPCFRGRESRDTEKLLRTAAGRRLPAPGWAGPARLSALERLIMQTRRSLSIIHRRLRLAEGSGQGDSAGRRTGPRGSARGRPAGRPLGSSCLGPAGGAGGGARPRPSRTAFLHPGLQASSPGCWSPQQEKLVCWFPERTSLCLRPPQPLVPQPPGPGRSLEKVELGPAGAAPATSLPARAPSLPTAARPLSLPGAPLLPAISSPTPRRAGQGTCCRDHSRAPELAAAGGADRCGWGKPRSGWRSALLPGT